MITIVCDFAYKRNGKTLYGTITERADSCRKNDLYLANLAISLQLSKNYPERIEETRSTYKNGKMIDYREMI